MDRKMCVSCGHDLPMEKFRPNYKSPDGHVGVCYDCLSKNKKKAQKTSTVLDAATKYLYGTEALDMLGYTNKHINIVNEMKSLGIPIIDTEKHGMGQRCVVRRADVVRVLNERKYAQTTDNKSIDFDQINKKLDDILRYVQELFQMMK